MRGVWYVGCGVHMLCMWFAVCCSSIIVLLCVGLYVIVGGCCRVFVVWCLLYVAVCLACVVCCVRGVLFGGWCSVLPVVGLCC